MVSVSDNCVFYLQIKTSIDFWCKHGLNPRYLIQLLAIPSHTLSAMVTLQI